MQIRQVVLLYEKEDLKPIREKAVELNLTIEEYIKWVVKLHTEEL